jgi:hypothetical protein
MPRCGDSGGLPTYIAIYSFHSSIRSIRRRVLVNRTSVWQRQRFSCTHGRAAAEEESDIEAAVEDTRSSGIDGCGVESDRDFESFGIKIETT